MKPSSPIRKYGHAKGRFGDRATRFCLMGAIYHTYLLSPSCTPEACSEVFNRVRDKIGCSNLATWNDQPGRTKGEVIKILRSIGE